MLTEKEAGNPTQKVKPERHTFFIIVIVWKKKVFITIIITKYKIMKTIFVIFCLFGTLSSGAQTILFLGATAHIGDGSKIATSAIAIKNGKFGNGSRR